MKFLNEAIRGEFHQLPLDRQKEITDAAEHFDKIGMVLTVLYVDRITETTSEMSIRIDKKAQIV